MSRLVSAQVYANIIHLATAYYFQTYPLTEQMVKQEIAYIYGVRGRGKKHPCLQGTFEWWTEWNSAMIKSVQLPEFPYEIVQQNLPEPPEGEFSKQLWKAIEKIQEEEPPNEIAVDDTDAPSGESRGDDGPADNAKQIKKGKKRGTKVSGQSEGQETKRNKTKGVSDGKGTDIDAGDPVVAQDIPGYNPVVKETASGQRYGCSEEFPVPDSFKFWIEEQPKSKRPYPRALTNFRFVNQNGQDVSAAIGHFGANESLRAIGIAASADQRWDSGQRIAAGWWNTDCVTRDRSPMEILWVEFQVENIKCETPAWFRDGDTDALVATSYTAEYILQAPHENYSYRWEACVVPQDHLFEEIDTTRRVGPKFMDRKFYLELKSDVDRWYDEEKAVIPTIPTISDAEMAMLIDEGRLANLKARKRRLGTELSHDIDVQAQLHEQYIVGPIPKDEKSKATSDKLLAKKQTHESELRVKFEKQGDLKKRIDEAQAKLAESQAGVNEGPLPQYVVAPDAESGPSHQGQRRDRAENDMDVDIQYRAFINDDVVDEHHTWPGEVPESQLPTSAQVQRGADLMPLSSAVPTTEGTLTPPSNAAAFGSLNMNFYTGPYM